MKALFFQVPSNSEVGKSYMVIKDVYGNWKCTCPRFVFKRNCKHLDAVHEWIIDNNGIPTNKSDSSSAINKGVVGPQMMGSQQVV
jgi:hypothetical protein